MKYTNERMEIRPILIILDGDFINEPFRFNDERYLHEVSLFISFNGQDFINEVKLMELMELMELMKLMELMGLSQLILLSLEGQNELLISVSGALSCVLEVNCAILFVVIQRLLQLLFIKFMDVKLHFFAHVR
jgi:hypothetical protein